MELTNKVVIITGAAQGIGLAIAKRLAMARALVAMVDVNVARVQDEAKKLIGLASALLPLVVMFQKRIPCTR